MNIIQANVVDGLQIFPTKYTFKVPDGVNIEKGSLLKVERYSSIFEAITNSTEVFDEALSMITDGKEVTSSVVGVYELHELKPKEQKEPEEVDWSKVEVGTPILVKNYEDAEWKKRYFAEYSDGRVYAWANGQTSWTADGCKLVWDCAKLAEVEND